MNYTFQQTGNLQKFPGIPGKNSEKKDNKDGKLIGRMEKDLAALRDALFWASTRSREK